MQERGVTAAILAGGLGTRLRPALPGLAKALAPVGGRPYVDLLLEQIAQAGISSAVLLVGHLAGQVRDALGDQRCGVRLAYSVEDAPLGTGGALAHARPLLRGRTVLLLNGDSHCGMSLAAFLRWHSRRRAEATMALARVADAGRYGQVEAAGGLVTRFAEKGPSTGPGWVNAGVYAIEPHLIDALPGGVYSLERGVFPLWVREGMLAAYRSSGALLDIGTPESYGQAEAHFGLTPRRAAG
jgi:NDP-sugar pyrophosphorylase family protein